MIGRSTSSSSSKQRVRKRDESGQCQEMATGKVQVIHSSKIPIQNRIPRTASELQLQEDTKAAEWRDLCMFTRLVAGMRERQNAQANHFRAVEREEGRGRGGRGLPDAGANAGSHAGPDAVRAYNRHALLTDQCVENIVWTRRQEISCVSISADDNEAESLSRTREIVGRRFSRGRRITHSEAYKHYSVEEERSQSAPPPLFPDLSPVSAAHMTQRGPSVVEPDEDYVFNLDL